MIEELKKRQEELVKLEKEAWANLNFILGREEELLTLIKMLEEKEETSDTD